MGAYSCKTLPFIKKKDYSDARAALKKMLIHMKKRGMEFRGCMRASFIAGKTGITMVGLDASFGTLESICTFPLLNVQFSEILSSVATGTLAPVDFKNLCSVAKFVTYDTYPSAIRKPRKIKVHEKKVWNQGAFAYYDSVIRKPEGFYLKTGRGIAMLAADSELARAEDRAEKAVHAVEGNLVHRPDIASEENVRKAKKHMALLRAL
jgi:phosphoribosylamine--glycine ligase